MYQINTDRSIKDGADLRLNVDFYAEDGTFIANGTVPVFSPQSVDDAIAEVEARDTAEVAQFTAAPVLDEILNQLTETHSGKLMSRAQVNTQMKVG